MGESDPAADLASTQGYYWNRDDPNSKGNICSAVGLPSSICRFSLLARVPPTCAYCGEFGPKVARMPLRPRVTICAISSRASLASSTNRERSVRASSTSLSFARRSSILALTVGRVSSPMEKVGLAGRSHISHSRESSESAIFPRAAQRIFRHEPASQHRPRL